MRKVKLTLALIVLTVASIAPLSSIAQNSNSKAAVQERTVIGFVSDNHCGLKHMSGMGDDKSCTLMCIKNGKFVWLIGTISASTNWTKRARKKPANSPDRR